MRFYKIPTGQVPQQPRHWSTVNQLPCLKSRTRTGLWWDSRWQGYLLGPQVSRQSDQNCANCFPRDRTLAGTLDVAMRCQVKQTEGGVDQVAAVTAITQRNGLNLGVGTSTGQV